MNCEVSIYHFMYLKQSGSPWLHSKESNTWRSLLVRQSDISQEENGEGSNSACICFGRDMSISSSLSVHINTFADAVRVPRNCLEGIWNKAAELLKTDDAIVPAPGVGADAKFVLSYQSNKPHLVIPKKGGNFACDSECPNWKALGICAHSVAVAELCKKLSEFIAYFKKVKKTPNLTKLLCPEGGGERVMCALENEKHLQL